MIDMSGKNCVVTGADRGMGYSIASYMIDCGANVIGIDINRNHTNFDMLTCDLTCGEQTAAAVDKVHSQFDSLDALVNCAGITIPTANDQYDFADWKKTMSVNLDAVFNLTNGLFHILKKPTSSSIINIASLNSTFGFPGNAAYVTSKTGLVGLSRSWAVDWGKYAIRSNCVAPGYIRTKMTEKSWNDEALRKQRSSRTCLDRWGNVDDVSKAVAFLASDMSCYITGQVLNVDGGWTARGL